jgi:hypothetical protein
MLLGERLKDLGGWTRNFFGESEVRIVLALTKIRRTKQLLRTDDIRTTPDCALRK